MEYYGGILLDDKLFINATDENFFLLNSDNKILGISINQRQ